MPRPDEPHMHDVTDKDIHRKEGVDPYPLPKTARSADQPQDDEQTSTSENNFERAQVDAEGEYLDAADKMRKTIKEDGAQKAWKDGRTQS